MKNSHTKSNLAWLWMIYIIYPFAPFVYAVKNFGIKEYRIFIVLLGVFYGFSYLPVEGSDSTRYVAVIKEFGNYPFAAYWSDITSMYNIGARFNDAYVYSVLFVVSKFSSDPAIYRLVYGLIYFLILVLLISSIYDYVKEKGKHKGIFWFLLGTVFIINISAGINGVRFPLALQLFLLGMFKYITSQNSKYLIICIAAFLVHFMIGYLLVFLLLYVFTKKFYNPIYSILIAMAFLLFSLAFENTISSNAGFLGEGIEQKADSYTTNEDYKAQRNTHLENLNWYVKLDRYSTYYFGILSLSLLILYRKKIYKDKIALDFEYFCLIMYIASFISGQLVDEISNRYYLFANASFLIYLFYLSSINDTILFARLKKIYIPIVVLHALIIVRVDINTAGPNLYLGNWLTEYFSVDPND